MRRLLLVLLALCLLWLPVRAAVSVNLTVQEAIYPGSTTGIARTDEIVTVGIPLPDSADGVDAVTDLGLSGASVGQFRELASWPSGKVQWVLVDTVLGSLSAGASSTAITLTTGSGTFGGSNLATDNGTTITVDTGDLVVTIQEANHNGFDQVVLSGTTIVSDNASDGFAILGPDPTDTYPDDVTCTAEGG